MNSPHCAYYFHYQNCSMQMEFQTKFTPFRLLHPYHPCKTSGIHPYHPCPNFTQEILAYVTINLLKNLLIILFFTLNQNLWLYNLFSILLYIVCFFFFLLQIVLQIVFFIRIILFFIFRDLVLNHLEIFLIFLNLFLNQFELLLNHFQIFVILEVNNYVHKESLFTC